MKYWILTVSFLPAAGMALFPFILLNNRQNKEDRILINHELIHLRQQVELLVIPFYLLYLVSYLFNLAKYKNHHKSYLNIIFEKEAYQMDKDLGYLSKRTFWAWLKYFK